MRNITIEKYASHLNPSMYDVVLDHIKPKNSFAKRQMNIYSMPYSNVRQCIRLMSTANNWESIAYLFQICFDVSLDVFWKQGILEFFSAKKFMISEFNRILKVESEQLSSSTTDMAMWKMAGGDKLKRFSDTLPLVQLGKEFGMYPFDIGRKPYSEVFTLLVQLKLQNEVEKEYMKLTTKQ